MMSSSLDKTKPLSEYPMGSPEDSEDRNEFVESDAGQVTPEAKRAGYGHSTKPEGHPMGGHNVDARNQYTVRPKRGSSF